MSKSDQIREARERLNMTQKVLAERLGVSRQSVSKWEWRVRAQLGKSESAV